MLKLSIVDDDELQKRKASRIPQNTRTNTPRKVRVWFEWAEESNDLNQIIGDNETIPQEDPDILNIVTSRIIEQFSRQNHMYFYFSSKQTSLSREILLQPRGSNATRQ